ncbi:hypothetical protein G6L98_26010 [Agrobacterium tumefaciens]|nr:hypothetical protein [Agrobacterium tumefaciens]
MIRMVDQIWEDAGYSRIEEGGHLRGRFCRLLIYHIEGFKTDLPIVGPLSHVIDGHHYTLAIGGSVNETCRALVNDELVEDEALWRKGNNTIGPYLVLKIGPTDEHELMATHFLRSGNEIWINGGCESATAELDQLHERVGPRVVSSLAIAFSSEHTVFRSIEAMNYGHATSGEQLRDMSFSMTAYAIVSKPIAAEEVRARVTAALERSSQLDRNVAGFFDLALKETDPTKQFLLFFIALELLTKTEFSKHYPSIVSSVSSATLPPKKKRELQNQFSWLREHALTTLSDQCVARFERLRKVRNLIAHGGIASPDPQSLEEVKILATAVLSSVIAENQAYIQNVCLPRG